MNGTRLAGTVVVAGRSAVTCDSAVRTASGSRRVLMSWKWIALRSSLLRRERLSQLNQARCYQLLGFVYYHLDSTPVGRERSKTSGIRRGLFRHGSRMLDCCRCKGSRSVPRTSATCGTRWLATFAFLALTIERLIGTRIHESRYTARGRV
jgi:hypothetical protein